MVHVVDGVELRIGQQRRLVDRQLPSGKDGLTQLTATVQSYTQQVISAFAQQGTPVDLVSIGNEIRNGILWPVGQVDPAAGTGFDNLATLLKAGVAGAQAGNPRGHRLLIMMHYDQGGNNQTSPGVLRREVPAKRGGRRPGEGGHGPACLAVGVLPVRRPAP